MRVGRIQSNGHILMAVEERGAWYPWVKGGDPRWLDGSSLADALMSTDREDAAAFSLTDPVVPTGPLLPPVAPPRNVMCLGKNYREHAREFAAFSGEKQVIPDAPVVFTKPVSALCGPQDVIVVDPEVTCALDYEVELGVLIGCAGAVIHQEDALSHVAGYTVLNDITARDLQQLHKQWFLGKSLPRATPVGPVVVSQDDFAPIGERSIRCWVNGELRQSARLADMIFGVAEAIAQISRIVPLERGDLIAMGTPSGVGVGFTPPRYLRDGDRVACEIEGIGRLDNTIMLRPGSVVTAGTAQDMTGTPATETSLDT